MKTIEQVLTWINERIQIEESSRTSNEVVHAASEYGVLVLQGLKDFILEGSDEP